MNTKDLDRHNEKPSTALTGTAQSNEEVFTVEDDEEENKCPHRKPVRAPGASHSHDEFIAALNPDGSIDPTNAYFLHPQALQAPIVQLPHVHRVSELFTPFTNVFIMSKLPTELCYIAIDTLDSIRSKVDLP